MFHKFCINRHRITPLKTRILQIQTTTEKSNLDGFSVLGVIRFCNLTNEHFEKKSPKTETSFKLHGCLRPLEKLEMSMTNVKI